MIIYDMEVLVISQYEYDILVITRVEAEDKYIPILCCSNLQTHVLVLQTGATFFEIFVTG